MMGRMGRKRTDTDGKAGLESFIGAVVPLE